MVKMSKKMRKLASTAMITTILSTSVLPQFSTVFAYEKSNGEVLKIAVASDLHIFPEEFVGNKGPNYQEYVNGDRKMLEESERILEATIQRILASDAEIVLIPGDLTKDSEKEGHEIVAKQLQRLEDAGKKVYVTNGNHDINANDAEKFVGKEDGTDEKVLLDGVTRDQFETIHNNFGFNTTDEDVIVNDPNSTSYVAQLSDGVRLLVMDTGIYGEDRTDQKTAGTLDVDGRLEWVLNQLAEAKKAGDRVIGMSHHGIVEHFDGQGVVFAPYLVERYDEISTLLADAGMEFVFTGHFHAQDVAVSKTTEQGNQIMDIMTGSSVSYPSPVRFIELDMENNAIDITSERIKSIDGVENFEKYSEEAMRAGVPGMVSSLLSGILTDLVDSMFNQTEPETVEGRLINEYMTEAVENAKEEVAATRSEVSELAIQDIFSQERLTNYIKAVCKGLETVTVQIDGFSEDYRFMQAIEDVLMEVYAGDEVYDEYFEKVYNALSTTPALADAFVKVLVENKDELKEGLGFGDKLVVEAVFNKKVLDGLFAMEISEGTTVAGLLGGAFAGLLDGIMTDHTPDNDVIYKNYKTLTADDVKIVVELAETIDRNKYTQGSLNVVDTAVNTAKSINEKSTRVEIEAAVRGIKDAVNALEKSQSVDFSDIEGHWAKEAIQRFTDKGYLDGYEDGTFKPDNNITRAEFVKVVNRFYGYTNKSEVGFTDVESDAWYYDDLAIALEVGYINGYEDGTFRPDQNITREEAAKILAIVADLKGDGNLDIKDADQISDWAKEYVDALSDSGIIIGYEDGTFKPIQNITRAESVTMMDRIEK